MSRTNSRVARKARDAAQLDAGYLPIPAAAKALHISPARAYALTLAGTLARRKAGGAVYVSKASVRAYRTALKPSPGCLTVKDAIARYHYGRSALYKHIASGAVRRQHTSGRVYLNRDDLDRCFARTGRAQR